MRRYSIYMRKRAKAVHDISCRSGRIWAWLHFYLKDHHLLRVWWWNLSEIAPDVWRSNQPSPWGVSHYHALGIRSVVSLRGKIPQSYNLLEAEACTTNDLALQHLPGITARGLRPAATILTVMDALAQVPKPVLFHCKSGADRTGFVAALYLILINGVPVAQASKQLARKHIHFKRSKSGVLGHVFRVYMCDVEPSGLDFRGWLETGYDPAAIEADFDTWRKRAGRWAV